MAQWNSTPESLENSEAGRAAVGAEAREVDREKDMESIVSMLRNVAFIPYMLGSHYKEKMTCIALKRL